MDNALGDKHTVCILVGFRFCAVQLANPSIQPHTLILSACCIHRVHVPKKNGLPAMRGNFHVRCCIRTCESIINWLQVGTIQRVHIMVEGQGQLTIVQVVHTVRKKYVVMCAPD